MGTIYFTVSLTHSLVLTIEACRLPARQLTQTDVIISQHQLTPTTKYYTQ